MIIYTDRVLDKLDTFIGRYEPERGGALLALPDSNIVVDFLPDPEGEMTGSSYVPSQTLTAQVQNMERQHGLAFCGVVHSHPGSYNQPSGQDDVAFRKGLDINPHLARFIAPIITVDGPAEHGSEFQRTLGLRSRMTSYVAYRSTESTAPWPSNRFSLHRDSWDELREPPLRDVYGLRRPERERPGSGPRVPEREGGRHLVRDTPGHVRLMRTAMDIMPIRAQMEALRAALEHKLRRHVQTRPGPIIELGGVSCLSESIQYDGGDVMVILPPTFPFTAPIVIEGAGEESHEIKFYWKMEFGTQPESLANTLINHLGGGETWRSI